VRLFEASKRIMRLVVLAVLGVLATAAADGRAQTGSSPGGQEPSAEETHPGDLPVSLERIREGLRKAPEQPILQGLDREADFRIEIREKARLDDILKRLDFKSGPAPAGGLYGFEQQQRLFRPVDRPLMQPYAAFNGGELVTIAFQNLLARYLGTALVHSLTDASHARAERAAKEEVDRGIADYCASRPDRWEILLCNPDR
jgi:hypothetical protein